MNCRVHSVTIFSFRLNNKSGQIIFCGHSLGGAVAGITALLAAEYVKKGLNLDYDRVMAITIGAPLFADEDARKFWKEEVKLQYHIVSNAEHDIVPPVLTLECLDKIISFHSVFHQVCLKFSLLL